MSTNGTHSVFKRQKVQVGFVTTDEGVGTVATASTTRVEEYGDGYDHLTRLTMTAFEVGVAADNASLAIGNKIYTLPAGTILITEASVVGGVTGTVSVTAQTPEIGLGTVIGSGAAAVLSTTMEDIMDGGAAGGIGGDLVAPDIAGATFYKASAITNPVIIKTTGGKARDIFLNAAVAWADVTAAGVLSFTGVVTLRWRKVT